MGYVEPAALVRYKKSGAVWATAYNAAECDDRDSTSNMQRLGSALPPPGSAYVIYRDALVYNIPGGLPTLASAHIISKEVYCSCGATSGGMYDATSLNLEEDAAYGNMLSLPSLIGTWSMPGLESGDAYWIATFNAAGLSFLESKAGSSARIALYSSDSPSSQCRIWGLLWAGIYDHLSRLYYNDVGGGYIWVEGTKLAYLDISRTKRLQEGTTTGTTGKVAGHLWVEGDYLHYIDNTGAERRILGTATSLSGKTASQISINTAQGGTKLCYIDSSGAERCFEGAT